MEANELRVGNYYQGSLEIIGSTEAKLNFYINREFILTKEKLMAIMQLDLVEFIKPISLTEEWLVKFGLHKNVNYIKQLGVHLDTGLAYFEDNEYGHEDKDDIEIKYVHQLQNIYFALTGEELKIK